MWLGYEYVVRSPAKPKQHCTSRYEVILKLEYVTEEPVELELCYI
jgi:hypothetical protein